MQKFQRMSDAEKQMMQLIWAAEEPITTSELLEKLPADKAWKQSTVITFLTRLIDKGMVKATRVGKANHYEACVTEQAYRNYETKQFIDDVHEGSAFGLISALCDTGDVTKEDIEKLMQQLQDMKE